MHKEHLAVYETAPVVYAFKLESHLYGVGFELVEMVLKVTSVD
jgi:hypothetical protein